MSITARGGEVAFNQAQQPYDSTYTAVQLSDIDITERDGRENRQRGHGIHEQEMDDFIHHSTPLGWGTGSSEEVYGKSMMARGKTTTGFWSQHVLGDDTPAGCSKVRRIPGWLLALDFCWRAIFPLCFLAIGVCVAKLDGEELSWWGKKLQSTIVLIPSVYPIMFAALTARTMQSIALYLAERGTTLGRLEQLLGSFTFGGTLYTHVMLRIANFSAIALIFIWTLSPLGGQAALRMLDIRFVITNNTNTSLLYRSSDSPTVVVSNSGGGAAFPRLNGLYFSAILLPEASRNASLDIFGNIKIPTIEDLERANSSKKDQSGWIKIDPQSPPGFSSLLGVPVYAIPKAGTLNFPLVTSYFRFDCAQPWNSSVQDAGRYFNTSSMQNLGFGLQTLMPSNASFDRNSAEDRDNNRRLIESARTLLWYSRNTALSGVPLSLTLSTCQISLSHVESEIHCPGGARSCFVRAMRRSPSPQLPANITYLDGTGSATINFLSFFELASGKVSRSTECTVTERFIYDPPTVYNQSLLERVNMFTVPREDFTVRLSLLFNTYWGTTLGTSSIPGIALNLTALDPPIDIASGPLGSINWIAQPPFLARRSKATIEHYDDRYVTRWGWWTLYMGSVLVLLLVSLAGVIVTSFTLTPDIFGYYATGFTRDNPHADIAAYIPKAEGVLDGSRKARLLKEVPVMVADVRPTEEVGRISFVTGGEKIAYSGDRGPQGVSRIRKGRWYT